MSTEKAEPGFDFGGCQAHFQKLNFGAPTAEAAATVLGLYEALKGISRTDKDAALLTLAIVTACK